MTSPDPITQIAWLEPTYPAREAAALLGRSYSWLGQRVRNNEFVLHDGTTVEPLRTPGGYRRFTLAMLRDIATSSYRQHWFSMDKLKSTIRELVMAAHRATGEYEIPQRREPCSGVLRDQPEEPNISNHVFSLSPMATIGPYGCSRGTA